ncbi:uncharacterized protein PV09_09715 [Verruconis gallopava]|uniref:CCHC-type domain-containing protein n=1 Tax=Verruconis gallopava TaxID=253628 RepID=A0A0D1X8W0_9PEZI|nr:uncharacterized protein PV09_09715 [Verruconis gallopava]KIV98470.1 hypothetical protein PV09_09715 [Verruconis gallopava]
MSEQLREDSASMPITDTELPTSTSTINEQIKELKKREADLQKRIQLKELKDKVARMEAVLEGQPTRSTPATEEEITQLDTDAEAAEPRAQSTTPQGKDIHPKDLPEYKGKSLREYTDWVDCAVNAFRLAPRRFAQEGVRVAWAQQFLTPSLKTTWSDYIRTKEEESDTTWKEFTTFLLDKLEDPGNRELSVHMAHARATQRKGQTVADFEAYLTSLEAQMTTAWTEKEKRNNLIAKLRVDLQHHLASLPTIPETRSGVVTLLTRWERTKKRLETETMNASSKRKFGDNDAPIKRSQGAEAAHRKFKVEDSESATNKKKETKLRCYKCDKVGHLARDCRKPKEDATNKGKASGSH